MKELVKYIARYLVDNPDEVDVREIAGDQSSVIELRTAKSDLGKVIGKEGRTAKAIRTLLSASSAKTGKRAFLEIVEDKDTDTDTDTDTATATATDEEK